METNIQSSSRPIPDSVTRQAQLQAPENENNPLTFYEYLQRDRHQDPLYRCAQPNASQAFGWEPVIPDTMHQCINFRGVDLLDMAQQYVEAELRNPVQHYSVRFARLLHWFLLLVIFIPLNLVVLFVWTLPIATLNSMRNHPLLPKKFPPYHWALRLSLWVIFVPYAKIASYGGLQPMLFLRTLQPPYGHARQTCLQLGKALVEQRERRLKHLKLIQQALAQEEQRALQDLINMLPENEEDGVRNIPTTSKKPAFNTGVMREQTQAWRRSARDSQFVKDQIAAVIAEIHEVSEISKTQTNKELTGYAGVSDWGKEALEARSAFLNAMTVICVLGAGLSYSSTMSALRGNISYMCYSFALFMIGLVVITLVQVVLTWCSQRSNYPFAAPFFWDFVIDILQCGAFATAAAAIILLMVSVQVLVVPNSSTSDAIRTFSPKPAAYATYALFGTILILLIVALYVFWSANANGFKFFLAQRFVHRRHMRTKRLEDFVSYPDFDGI